MTIIPSKARTYYRFSSLFPDTIHRNASITISSPSPIFYYLLSSHRRTSPISGATSSLLSPALLSSPISCSGDLFPETGPCLAETTYLRQSRPWSNQFGTTRASSSYQHWAHPPFSAIKTDDGKIFARGAQDDKCIAIQYLEALRNIIKRDPEFKPIRTLHICYVPDEEIGGFDGMQKFVESKEFKEMNVGFFLDEGQASTTNKYRVFYADRSPWNLVIKAVGKPGHGSKMFDDTAMENLMKSIEVVSKFRENQFDLVKTGVLANSEVVSANPVYLKAGTPSKNGNFVMNMQPSEAEVGYDVRLPPTVDPDLLKKRIAEEWAPKTRNMSYHIVEKGPLRDYMGRPLITATNDSNPWWNVFKDAVEACGGVLEKPEILSSTTDARYIRQLGIPTFGFSPMKNTQILLHDHNEYLEETVFLEGIKVYESIIKSLSSFEG
ncbi:unnamed protein product [Lactuca saligna]|uniref:Peptidase M20 dimerisation domain-containing protein n=1 Tax=Lactuca saligna TaxID=75948 RepID=A0AA35ZP05_LACSI|nr:unnamed protein product [Lactuca saligna]